MGGYLFVTRPAQPTARQKLSFIFGPYPLYRPRPPRDDGFDCSLLLAHMVQHLLLILLAAPLLLYGTPAWLLEPLTRKLVTNTIGYWLTRPVVASAIANAIFVLWHAPMFCEMALRSQPVHVFEHMTMLATALLAWWPTLGSLPQWPCLALPLHSLDSSVMTVPSAAVGTFITFADSGLYAPYDTAQRIFGIELSTDQQFTGLLMGVAVSVSYLLLITYSFFRWAPREEAADAEAARIEPPPAPIPHDPGARATN